MAKPKEPIPDRFHCFNTTSATWMHGRVLDNVLYVHTPTTYARYNLIVQTKVPSTCPVANTATWREVGREELTHIALYGTTTGYRNVAAENELAKAYAARPIKPVKKVAQSLPSPGIWMQPSGDHAAKRLSPGRYLVDVHDDNGYIAMPVPWAVPPADPLAEEIGKYPAYWRKIPDGWQALDFYRVRAMFPLPAGYESARLDHALKKLLIPGNRTGGKSVYKDLKEAHATLGQWLREHKDLEDAPVQQ